MAVVTSIVLAIFVLPKFRTFFASLNAKLPLPTRMLLSVSDSSAHGGGPSPAIILVAVVAFVALRRSKQGTSVARLVLLKLPVAGSLLQAASSSGCAAFWPRSSRPESICPGHGGHGRGIEQRRLHRRAQPHPGADDGRNGLAAPLAETGLFPAAARQMFRVGEETGTLDKQLHDGGCLLPPGT